MGSDSDDSIEFTPTWIIAAVCTVIVSISLIFERLLHFLGKKLKKNKEKSLYRALLKVKEELMLLGFIVILLTVFQGAIQHICIPQSWALQWLPCTTDTSDNSTVTSSILTFNKDLSWHHSRAERSLFSRPSYGSSESEYCTQSGHVSLLSLEVIDQIHVFLFALAVTHVVLSLMTLALGMTQINNWYHWEDTIQKENKTTHDIITDVKKIKFVQERFKGFGKASGLLSWMYAFGKQFYGSITIDDYRTLRLGFLAKHVPGDAKYNFYNYMIRALQHDFKKVIGISWYHWGFVVIFLLSNVAGWHAYFWISLVPLVLLFVLGAKLEHIITELAHEVVEKHAVVLGDFIVTPSDTYFWFGRPKIVLFLIRFILFQNAFEIAFFFWILVTFGYNSCIMDKTVYILPRLAFSVTIQLVCSYSTLPLYAIVSNMGSQCKEAIFIEEVQAGLKHWMSNHRRQV